MMPDNDTQNTENACVIHKIILTESEKCPQCILTEHNSDLNGDSPKVETFSEKDSQPLQPENSDNNEKASESVENPPPDEEKKSQKTKNSAEFKDLDTNQIVSLQNTQFRDFIQYTQSDSKISLFEKSDPLSFESCNELDDSFSNLIAILKKERFLVLGDAGDGEGYVISCQISKSFKGHIKDENLRRFYLYRHETEKPSYIHSFDFERKAVDEEDLPEALVIIEATSARSEFADSLLKSGVSFTDALPATLRKNNLFLICVILSEHIKDWKKNLDKRHFPYQIIDNQDEEEKQSEIEFDVSQKAGKLLAATGEIDGAITKTLLFVASFFPNLATVEFNDLVCRWLNKEPDITRLEAVENSSEEVVSTKISLRQVWDAKAHIFTEQCFLIQTKDKQNKKIVSFDDESYSMYFKTEFESKYFVFLNKKISDVLEFELIFHSSERVSNQSIAILCEYIPEIEDKFKDWIFEVFRVLESVENLDELKRRFKAEENIGKYFYYVRLAVLFRTMLSDAYLKTIIDKVLDQLIHNTLHKSVLILVKLLYYAPNFDGLRWLKQILERGDSATQEKAIEYLFVNLINVNVDTVVESLKSWLPDKEMPVERYSRANKVALTLLIDYYSYQIYIFDEQLYGSEHCQFPLFVFDDKAVAHSRFEFLVKYLLHPANFILLSGEMPYIYHVAHLLERWAAILYRKPDSSGIADTAEETIVKNSFAEFLGNEEILDILLEQVVLSSDKNKQEELSSIWERFVKEMEILTDDISIDWKVRKNASKRRKIVRNLVENFKKIKRSKRENTNKKNNGGSEKNGANKTI